MRTKNLAMVILVMLSLCVFGISGACAEEISGVYSATAPSSVGYWTFASAGMPFSMHSLDDENDFNMIDMPIGTWYAFNSESELPASFIFSTRIGDYEDLNPVSLSSVAPNGTANASSFRIVALEDGTQTMQFESDGLFAMFFSGIYESEANEIHLIHDGSNSVPLPSYAAEGFVISLVHINPSFSEILETSSGNYTINSSLPIVILSQEEANNTDFYNLSSYTWYVFEGVDEAGNKYVDCINAADKPAVPDGLPDFSKMNIEVISSGNELVPGTSSSASNFSAFIAETGEAMLDFESANFTYVGLFNDDGSSKGNYIPDGNPIPLGNFTESRTHVALARQI